MELGLKVINVSEYPIHAGTMRLIISKEDSVYEPDGIIEEYLKKEEKYGFELTERVEQNIFPSD